MFLSDVIFPKADNIKVNMMPIISGDLDSIPQNLQHYWPLIKECAYNKGDIVYLTITESIVEHGKNNRRGGVHTDATCCFGWGGGTWGGSSFGGTRFGGYINGICLASSDGACRVWDESVESTEVDKHGALLVEPRGNCHKLEANKLYTIGDRQPHESLPTVGTYVRQFFRIVGPEVSVWWKQHSTENPLGVQPNAKILTHSKFD